MTFEAFGVLYGQILVPLEALWGHFWRWCGAARQPGARAIQAAQRETDCCMILGAFWVPFGVDLGIFRVRRAPFGLTFGVGAVPLANQGPG